MKTYLFIIVLAVFGIALLYSCQKEELDTTEVATQTEVTDLSSLESDSPIFARAKGGKGQRYYFEIEVDGPGELSSGPFKAGGKSGMQSKYCDTIVLAGLDILTDYCFDENTPLLPHRVSGGCDNGTVLNISEDRDDKLYMGYWFRGYGDPVKHGEETVIDYIIYMYSDVGFPDNWPGIDGEEFTFSIKSWELRTKSGKNKNLVCKGGDDNTESIDFTITVRRNDYLEW